MDGLIFDIKKYSVNDGPGIRTTIFFKGCPLRCWWCHNPESQEPQQEIINTSHKLDEKVFYQQKTIGNFMKPEEVLAEIIKDAIFYEESGGGVTFSGGEPTMQAEFLYALAKGCKLKNIHTALDTCGYAKKNVFTGLLHLIDLFLFDLKLIDNELHKQYTGLSNQVIIENLKFLSKSKAEIIIRVPVIPGITDKKSNMEGIAALISELPERVQEVHLLPYHKIASNKYIRLAKPNLLKEMGNMNKEDVKIHSEFFETKGFKVKIGG